MRANDTSALVGYAPLSRTERLVLEAERYLNGSQFKASFPDTGEDVKVLGIRTRRQLELTVAMPFLEEHIESEAAYFRRKGLAEDALRDHLARSEPRLSTSVVVNALDRPGQGIGGVYLSLLGTSAEDADSGQVGRGNRVNGVISLARPAPSEAAAGKNPVSHVGKIYNVLTHRIAGRIYGEVPGLQEVYVWLCSRIGAPVDESRLAATQVLTDPDVSLAKVRPRAIEIFEEELAGLPVFILGLTEGHYSVH